jgi:hypothetical protein
MGECFEDWELSVVEASRIELFCGGAREGVLLTSEFTVPDCRLLDTVKGLGSAGDLNSKTLGGPCRMARVYGGDRRTSAGTSVIPGGNG